MSQVTYDVRAYGAVGDGVTDDHAAFQSAVNAASAAGGGVVYASEGTYAIKGSILPASNVTIMGDGMDVTVLLSSVGYNGVINTNASATQIVGFGMHDFTINVNNANHGSGIGLQNVSRVLIECVRVTNVATGGWGMNLTGLTAQPTAIVNTFITLRDCYFDTQDSTLEMLLIANAQHVEVLDCDFSDNYMQSGPGLGVWQLADDVQIRGCRFRAMAGAALYANLSVTNITIDDCVFYGTGAGTGGGLGIGGLSDHGNFGFSAMYGVSVTNCAFQGLSVAAQVGSVSGFTMDNCDFDTTQGPALVMKNMASTTTLPPQFWQVSNCRFHNNNAGNTYNSLNPAILFGGVGGNHFGQVVNCSFWDDAATHTQTYPVAFSGAFTWDYITFEGCYIETYHGTSGWNLLMLDYGALLGPNVIVRDTVVKQNGNLQRANADWKSLVTVSASYAVNPNLDSTVLATGGTAGVTVTLPTAVGCSGRLFTILKADAAAGAVTVATTASQTLNGAATHPLTAQYARVIVQSDGANWWVTGS